jgi:hypothetical protein
LCFALWGALWTSCHSSFDFPSLFKSCVKIVTRIFLPYLITLRINNNESPCPLASSRWRWIPPSMNLISSCGQSIMGGIPDLGIGEGLSTISPKKSTSFGILCWPQTWASLWHDLWEIREDVN